MIKQAVGFLFDKAGYVVRSKKPVYDTELYRKYYSDDSIVNRRFYNIAAGRYFHPCWTGVDLDSDWYGVNHSNIVRGINSDLLSCGRIPVDDNSAELVYSSHTIEHVTQRAAQNLFNEAYRMLKGNGVFRVVTPDIMLEYDAYCRGDKHFFYWGDVFSRPQLMPKLGFTVPFNSLSVGQMFLMEFATSLCTCLTSEAGADRRVDDIELECLFNNLGLEKALDYLTGLCPVEIQQRRQGNHINWFNEAKLFRMLREAGFTKMYRSGYGQSVVPVLRNLCFFDCTHPKESIYVEARKE